MDLAASGAVPIQSPRTHRSPPARGFCGAQGIFFRIAWARSPTVGLAHGLGLSSLLQELRLPQDDLLPSVVGFNIGVEVGQVAALAVFIGFLAAARAFPFPSRQQVPAGFALMSASSFLLAFVVLGVSL